MTVNASKRGTGGRLDGDKLLRNSLCTLRRLGTEGAVNILSLFLR